MNRWLVLSPTVVSLVSLGAGLTVARWFVRGEAVGVIIGAGVAAVVAGGVALTQRFFGRTTVSHLEEAERRVRLDPLTGLLNRSALMEALTAALERGKATQTCVGVLFSDLDRFKVVNDSLGHDAGDRLLVAVADRLRESVRVADVVARFGGDEFVVICHGFMEQASISKVAQTILGAFERPFSMAGGDLVITTSVGVAVWDPATGAATSAENMMRDADAAMYQAKRSRSGVSIFDSEVRQNLLSRLKIEQSLAMAFDSELVVHYQPVIDAHRRRIHSVEALVRWDHPTHGLLFPNDFLPVAEEAGLMVRIGDVVLREACAQAAQWNQLAPECRYLGMSVNVAESQILDASFPTRVAEILEWAGLPASQLCLEISEDLVSEHLSGSVPVLQQIAAQGVRLSLDDFGTGRTTLSHLKLLNNVVHQVKIDREFVHELPVDPVDHAVVEAIARIANVASLEVIAEGVETHIQAGRLRDLGIHNHQGFLYSRAVPADQLNAVFANATVTENHSPSEALLQEVRKGGEVRSDPVGAGNSVVPG